MFGERKKDLAKLLVTNGLLFFTRLYVNGSHMINRYKKHLCEDYPKLNSREGLICRGIKRENGQLSIRGFWMSYPEPEDNVLNNGMEIWMSFDNIYPVLSLSVTKNGIEVLK